MGSAYTYISIVYFVLAENVTKKFIKCPATQYKDYGNIYLERTFVIILQGTLFNEEIEFFSHLSFCSLKY